ncbi:MAG: hypothetical protein KDB00_08655 [Planctomycetales bacterium]|nr:hypothetical protein [Planctomycetales bacterium]
MLNSKICALLMLVGCMTFVGCSSSEPTVIKDIPEQTEQDLADYEKEMESEPIQK